MLIIPDKIGLDQIGVERIGRDQNARFDRDEIGTDQSATDKIGLDQSPICFWRCSQRSWASRLSVAIGRASRRSRPISSSVSSQKP